MGMLVYNLCLPTCTLSLKEKYRSLQSARTEFRIDHYKRFYSLKEAGLFQKAKTFLIFRHFEIFLILFHNKGVICNYSAIAKTWYIVIL